MCLNSPRQTLGIRKLSGGFTLIETLVATAILVSGLVAVAYLFTYSIRTNMMTEQQTSATLLLYNKMEELRGTSYLSLTAGGGLDASSPTTNYWDYVTIGTSGTITSDTSTTDATYLRLWQVMSGTNTKVVSVVVYTQNSGIGMQQMELARASTEVTSGF